MRHADTVLFACLPQALDKCQDSTCGNLGAMASVGSVIAHSTVQMQAQPSLTSHGTRTAPKVSDASAASD